MTEGTLQEGSFHIQVPDNRRSELFLEALKTIPIETVFYKLEFTANGILKTLFKTDEEAKTEYLENCRKNRIMPYTSVILSNAYRNSICEISSGLDTFFTRRWDIEEEVGISLGGGRIHEYNFEGGDLSNFVRKWIPRLSKEDYQLTQGRLAFSYHKDNPAYLVFLDKRSKKSTMELMVDSRISSDDINKFKSWFDLLKDKYEYQQLQLIQPAQEKAL